MRPGVRSPSKWRLGFPFVREVHAEIVLCLVAVGLCSLLLRFTTSSSFLLFFSRFAFSPFFLYSRFPFALLFFSNFFHFLKFSSLSHTLLASPFFVFFPSLLLYASLFSISFVLSPIPLSRSEYFCFFPSLLISSPLPSLINRLSSPVFPSFLFSLLLFPVSLSLSSHFNIIYLLLSTLSASAGLALC